MEISPEAAKKKAEIAECTVKDGTAKLLITFSGCGGISSLRGGKDDHCIIVKSLFFQAIYKSPEIFIKTCALTEVIRIFFGSISL